MVRMWNTSASELQPDTRQDTHTYTAHYALGPLKKEGGGGKQVKEGK